MRTYVPSNCGVEQMKLRTYIPIKNKCQINDVRTYPLPDFRVNVVRTYPGEGIDVQRRRDAEHYACELELELTLSQLAQRQCRGVYEEFHLRSR